MRAPVGTLHPSSTVLSLALEAPSALDTSGITSSAGQAARVSALAVAAMDWRAFSCKSRGRGGEGARGGGCELGGRRAPLELVAMVAGQAEKGHSTVVRPGEHLQARPPGPPTWAAVSSRLGVTNMCLQGSRAGCNAHWVSQNARLNTSCNAVQAQFGATHSAGMQAGIHPAGHSPLHALAAGRGGQAAAIGGKGEVLGLQRRQRGGRSISNSCW